VGPSFSASAASALIAAAGRRGGCLAWSAWHGPHGPQCGQQDQSLPGAAAGCGTEAALPVALPPGSQWCLHPFPARWAGRSRSLLAACCAARSGAYNLYALADHLHSRGLYRNLFGAIHSLNGKPKLKELSPTFQIRWAAGRESCLARALGSFGDPSRCLRCRGVHTAQSAGTAAAAAAAQEGTSHFRSSSASARPLAPCPGQPHVGRKLPRFLILHGTVDKSVPMEVAVEFVTALKVCSGGLECSTLNGCMAEARGAGGGRRRATFGWQRRRRSWADPPGRPAVHPRRCPAGLPGAQEAGVDAKLKLYAGKTHTKPIVEDPSERWQEAARQLYRRPIRRPLASRSAAAIASRSPA
jgi:hypothetical protein